MMSFFRLGCVFVLGVSLTGSAFAQHFDHGPDHWDHGGGFDHHFQGPEFHPHFHHDFGPHWRDRVFPGPRFGPPPPPPPPPIYVAPYNSYSERIVTPYGVYSESNSYLYPGQQVFGNYGFGIPY